MFNRIFLFSALIASLGISSLQTRAQEALCAEVKIEILQELTMERQGFEASMRITNSLDSFSLENVSVSVNFTDANGNPVVATSNTAASNAAFFIRIDDTRDISGLHEGADGLVENGSIAPKKVGELRWLIIPTANAAGQVKDGKLYFVGAQLRYSYGGKEEVVDVAADSIVVKPQPALTLDYFLTREIVGDDGFTTEIEPPVPYTLGVRINNTGYGYAKSVKIESAQPTIVENKLGLAVDFKILSSYLADQPAAPTLLINFGTIDPQAVSVGRWLMETNLAGKFIAFTASFTHADELGGELTSLLQATNAHFLVRDVLVNLPGRDNIRDFLAFHAPQDLFVYESENTGLNHALCNHCAAVTTVTASLSEQGATSQATHSPEAGFTYAKLADPYNGTRVLSRVVRSDGVVLNPRNAWLSKERAANNISFDHFINIFDSGSSGSYTLHWGGLLADEPQPPVIQYLADRTTYEGGNVGFLVQASDPNNTVPTLTVNALPTGATFTNQAPNTGVMQWSPAVGQAGLYALTFTASDGSLTSERAVNVRVNPAYDIDGDGLDDDWEREHFGNLDQDGSGDADGDGRTDLQEFEEGTDPNVAEMVPGTPQILSPIFDADILDGAILPLFPSLSVTNANHGVGIDDVAVIFEVYSDEGLTELIAAATIDEGENTTHLQLSAEHMVDEAVLADNRLYYWRARSRDNTNTALASGWVKSRFFINTANDVPSVPNVISPAADEITSSVSPELIVTNAVDVDRDRLYYRFVLYEESQLASPLVEVTSLPPGNNGQTRWRVPRILHENGRYLWQAIVTDEYGLAVSSDWNSFLVSTINEAPTAPTIEFPARLSEVTELGADNSLVLRINKATDPERSALVYYFELDSVNTFDSELKQISGAISEQSNITWIASNLEENVTYFWRVRASDGSLFSPWALGEFTISVENEAPSTPTLQNPVSGVVATLRPLLEINPAIDPEGELLSYRFEIFSTADLTELIAEKVSYDAFWALDFDLIETNTYYWRVRAEDVQGLAGNWSNIGSFTVSLPVNNIVPQMNFVLPTENVTVENNIVLLQWVDSDPDSSAVISLYLHAEADEPILIVSDIGEDLDGESDQYLLDTSSLPAGTYGVSAVITDEHTSVTTHLCCSIAVQNSDIELPSLPGLHGQYYGYDSAVNGGPNLNNLNVAKAFVDDNNTDLTFVATHFEYGPGQNNLGLGDNLVAFLGNDAASMIGDRFSTTSAILQFTGNISLAAGSYRFRVRADDGYEISINGNIVAQHNGNQSATTRTHAVFDIAETGSYAINIIYWDSASGHEFGVEISNDGGVTYQYLGEQLLSHDAQESPDDGYAIGVETVTYTSGLAGIYQRYVTADHDGVRLTNLTRALDALSEPNPDLATFVSTQVNYGPGVGGLAVANNLQQFLGIDAGSLSQDPADADGGIIHLSGKISLEAGSYRLRVRADDGYRVRVSGKIVAQHPSNQGATTRTHDPFSVAQDGLYDFEIIYWDAGAGHTLKIEMSSDQGATYQILDSEVLATAVYHDDIYTYSRNEDPLLITEGGGNDKIVFGAGISAEQLWFSRSGDALLIGIVGTEDLIKVSNWYVSTTHQVEMLELSNGLVLPSSNVQPLVDVMATMAPPPLGQTVLAADQLNYLQTYIDAAWTSAE